MVAGPLPAIVHATESSLVVLSDESSALALKVPFVCQQTVATFVTNSNLSTSRVREGVQTALLKSVTWTV